MTGHFEALTAQCITKVTENIISFEFLLGFIFYTWIHVIMSRLKCGKHKRAANTKISLCQEYEKYNINIIIRVWIYVYVFMKSKYVVKTQNMYFNNRYDLFIGFKSNYRIFVFFFSSEV